MKFFFSSANIKNWARLLRWDKPSGRLILLIPAGWSLWLTPSGPPSHLLTLLIVLGGLSVSGAGCIVNDLWDIKIDRQVERTKNRPLAQGTVTIATAWILLILFLLISLSVVLCLPVSARNLCLQLACTAIIPILIYPSSKRWFKYPQALLSICWGFAVLIPWAAVESSLNGGWTLLLCWIASMTWTFGFDTVYAMADQTDDKKLGLNSSAIHLGEQTLSTVSFCYALSVLMLGACAYLKGLGLIFWPIWLITSLGMQREVALLKGSKSKHKALKTHFRNEVLLGALIFLGLILGQTI